MGVAATLPEFSEWTLIHNLAVVSLRRLTASIPCKFQGVGLLANLEVASKFLWPMEAPV